MTDWKNTLKKAEELFDQGQLNEAERLGQSVLRVEPVNARAFQLLGLVCSERHDTKRAIEHLQTALRHCFNLAPSHNGLGLCYFALDQLDRALHHFNIAIEIEPGHARAHFNRSLVWLKRGQFQLGWPEYEWRFSTGLVAHPPIPRPRWEGSRLDGRSLLVFTEQGIGDVLQFIRFLRNISKDGGRIVLACQRALQPLLKHLPTVDSWFPIDEEAPIDFDCFIPLLSLPSLLEIDESTIPCNIPYLPVEHLQVEKWQSRLTRECNSEASNATDLRQLSIGLSWQGSKTFQADYNRSIPLECFLPLDNLPAISLICLQKGVGLEQIQELSAPLKLIVFEDLDSIDPFVDTAALMHSLDLVITSDTAIAHLAGALGRPVWVLLGTGADWRWLEERLDSPWYPTMRIFRQQSAGDWTGVITEVIDELQNFQTGKKPLQKPKPQLCQNAKGNLPLIEQAETSNLNSSESNFFNSPHVVDERSELLTSVHTDSFPLLLRELNISIAVTTYQAGRLIFLRADGAALNTHFRSLERPMGLAYTGGHLAVGCGMQVIEFFNVPAVAPKIPPLNRHDACFLPRRAHFTGDIDVHEMAFADDGSLWFVNTRFSCLCNLDLQSSFLPRWQPSFISRLSPDDRCHLNGLAIVDGKPRYATALGISDEREGWREKKLNGGILIDIVTNQILLENLSMPHSPRWYKGRLWLLESGQGSLGWVDIDSRTYHKLCDLPGFTRGIDFLGPYAFVGISQVRESAVFAGIPLGKRLLNRQCGIYVIHIDSGEVVAFLQFTGGVQEIFAVQALPGLLFPELINEPNEWLQHSYVLPDEFINLG